MEKDEDVNEFRIVMEYFCFEDWEMIARRLRLSEYTIENVREQYRNKPFQEQFYQILWKWKQFCPEKSNIEELIKVLRAQNLNGPADKIDNAIKKYRSADPISKENILQRAVLRWKQTCPETKNDEKQSTAVEEENLNEPALNIDDAQKGKCNIGYKCNQQSIYACELN